LVQVYGGEEKKVNEIIQRISYVFFDKSQTSTASSLTQQNIVADLGDQQISYTGFWKYSLIN
jgi:hypothetical protein